MIHILAWNTSNFISPLFLYHHHPKYYIFISHLKMPTKYKICICSELGCDKKTFTNPNGEIERGVSMSSTTFYKHQQKILLFKKNQERQSPTISNIPSSLPSTSHPEVTLSSRPIASTSQQRIPLSEEVCN